MSEELTYDRKANKLEVVDMIRLPRADVEAVMAQANKVPTLEAEIDRLTALVPKCDCGPWNPNCDGPAEDCPVHGRSYDDWVMQANEARASLRQLTEPSDAVVEAMAKAIAAAHTGHSLQTVHTWFAITPQHVAVRRYFDQARAALAAGVAAALADPRNGAAGTRDTGTSEGGEGL